MSAIPLAVQLYTLRDLVAKDFVSAINQVAQIGYAGVELAGYGNLGSAGAVKRSIDEAGLRIVAVHVGIETLETEFDRVVDEQRTLNNTTIICPWIPQARREDAAGWKRVAHGLNQIGTACRERGLEFCYHNHSFEFQEFDGQTGMDILLGHGEPTLVKIELDTYWLQHGGQDPVAFINRLGNRVPLVHLKDMASGPDRRFAPVGTGVLDFAGILRAMRKSRARWGVVEQDDCYTIPPMESVRTSFNHLKTILAS